VPKLVVVGSGASAVHFSLTALEQGWEVTMLDVGREKPPPVRPEDTFDELKRNLDDPAGYFLGDDLSGMMWPGAKGEYYGFPPHKQYIFAGVDPFASRSRGFQPLVSFAQGGLAEAWTGGAFPFNDAELEDYPFGWDEIAPYYGAVAERIGIGGADDDLSRFSPVHRHLGVPPDLDEHSSLLLARYELKKAGLNGRLGTWIGRSRVATLRDDRPDGNGHRNGCSYLGRCLWSCPNEALWTPVQGLRALRGRAGFTYVPGVYVTHVEAGDDGRVTRVHGRRVDGGAAQEHAGERFVLAAGTLSSSKIFLESLKRGGGAAPVLSGLMDNRQILLPFFNLEMIAKPADNATYQYHNLALGLEAQRPKEYVHGLITTLKSALVHPIVQSVPFDLRSAVQIFRNVHAALGILNVNYCDDRRDTNTLQLDEEGRLVVDYRPSPDEPARVKRTLGVLKKALRKLGCLVPPGMAHVRPMGASVHYAGTLPMSAGGDELSTTPDCRSRAFDNLWFVDGTTFPFLPAKNLTFTLMANATRVAQEAFS
jgi:choline dehydrogenase-like flavoprotein